MSKLSKEPQNIDEDTWYYEDKKGIDVVVWRTFSGERKVTHVEIPWRMLHASLERKDSPPSEGKDLL